MSVSGNRPKSRDRPFAFSDRLDPATRSAGAMAIRNNPLTPIAKPPGHSGTRVICPPHRQYNGEFHEMRRIHAIIMTLDVSPVFAVDFA